MKKISVFLGIILGIVFLAAGAVSCTSEINLNLNKDGSVDVKFNGAAGVAFTKLILAANGASEEEGAQIAFDTTGIAQELAGNGFSNVKVSSSKGSDLSISMTDVKRSSTLFSSKVIAVDKNKLNAVLSPAQLKEFYEKSDEGIVMFLDMLLAPVFNDEVMSQSEYLEVMGSFYGEDAAKELSVSSFKVTFTNPDGSFVTQNIPMATLLTLQDTICIK